MYDISKLSLKEIMEIKDDDRQKYYDFALMSEGIVLMEMPKNPKDENVIEKTVKAYTCGSIHFKNQDDALAFSKLEAYKDEYDYQIGYDKRYLRPLNNQEIVVAMFYDEHDLNKHQAGLQKINDEQKAYEDQLSKYKKNQEKITSVYKTVSLAFKEADHIKYMLEKIKSTYQENITLCNGDKKIALLFLEKQFDGEQALDIFKESEAI